MWYRANTAPRPIHQDVNNYLCAIKKCAPASRTRPRPPDAGDVRRGNWNFLRRIGPEDRPSTRQTAQAHRSKITTTQFRGNEAGIQSAPTDRAGPNSKSFVPSPIRQTRLRPCGPDASAIRPQLFHVRGRLAAATGRLVGRTRVMRRINHLPGTVEAVATRRHSWADANRSPAFRKSLLSGRLVRSDVLPAAWKGTRGRH